jgi:hypothetical protein
MPLNWVLVERCMDVVHRRYASTRRDLLEYRAQGNSNASLGDVDADVLSDVMRTINDDP